MLSAVPETLNAVTIDDRCAITHLRSSDMAVRNAAVGAS